MRINMRGVQKILKQLKGLKNLDLERPTIYFLLGVLIMAVGFALYFRQEAREARRNPQRVVQEETEKLLASVSKLIVLPERETPTVATVNDPEGLSGQPFFAKAKKGDKVLIYTNARRAILYDPEDNKIVNVAPLVIGNQTPSPVSESPEAQ